MFPGATLKLTFPPEQNVVGPLAEMFTLGKAFTFTVIGADVAVHPPCPVMVTVKVAVDVINAF